MPLSPFELTVVRTLRRSAAPLSGRQVAELVGVAPNTANKTLRRLQTSGLVDATRVGRAQLWTTTADAGDLPELHETPHQRVALVVTAVDLEHSAVRNRLINLARDRVAGTWLMRGEIPGHHVNWTVFLGRAGMGNATSAALVGMAAKDLKANLVAFVGTAGGLKPDDQRHGDVVVASRIHNPYSGKQIPTSDGAKLLGRDTSYNVPAPLLSLVSACIDDSAWTPAKSSPHYSSKHPHAYTAPIVSVEAVQVDPSGPVVNEIRERFQNAAAIDMESFGLAAGSDIHDLPVLAFRGISDFLGDKANPGNDDVQPTAAGNAAQLLREVLAYAHPDDFKRGAPILPTPPDPNPSASDESTYNLPNSGRTWLNRLEQRSPERARTAREDIGQMRGAGLTAATFLNRALHRPPAWLREDDTGDGWAFIASLASIADSKVTHRAFEQAARAAQLTGQHDASAFFSLCGVLEQLGSINTSEDVSIEDSPDIDAGVGTVASIDQVGGRALAFQLLQTLRTGRPNWLVPVVDFFAAVVERDLHAIKASAEVAVAALGLRDETGVLQDPDRPAKSVVIEPHIRDFTAAIILRQLALMMLAPGAADELNVPTGLAAPYSRGNPVTRDLADDGLRLARWAADLRPGSEGARLTQAQTMLAVLISMSGRTSTDIEDEISRQARLIEADALDIRDVYRDWGGDTGSALAVAARARSIQGDFIGALRLLQPAPDGVATPQEAKHPEVIRIASFIARAAGKDELALQLASRVTDPAERELLRAAVLADSPQMTEETNEALLAVLRSGGDNHATFQALMALSRRYKTLRPNERREVVAEIDHRSRRDPDLADVLRARLAISEGDADQALVYVRGLTRNELALDAHADALILKGDAEQAARLLFDEGSKRGDIPLMAAGLEIAIQHGLLDSAHNIALHLLAHPHAAPVRRKANRALQHVARMKGEWNEVASRTEIIISEAQADHIPIPETEFWILAEAYYFAEKYEQALQAITRSESVTFTDRGHAHLLVSILHRVNDEQRVPPERPGPPRPGLLSNPKTYSMFMRAAAEWADDEQIAAAAMGVVLMAPDQDLNDVQIAQFRKYAEDYFERHGEDASITQIDVEDDNLDNLIEFLESDGQRKRALDSLANDVIAGRLPLAVLTELAQRTCTESLIRCDLDQVLAVDGGDHHENSVGIKTAHKALKSKVVVDTTTLTVAAWTGHPFRKLAARFEGVLVSTEVRDDVLRARNSLAMRSTTTMGWDDREGRPFISETSPDLAAQYAEAAEQVWAVTRELQLVPGAPLKRGNKWLSAVMTAQELGVPVWADDYVLRQLSRSMGVPAFSSLDLIRATSDERAIDKAVEALRQARVVDLPMEGLWFHLAFKANWDLRTPFALAITRPFAWRDIPAAFDEYQRLIRLRPDDMEPARLAGWAHHAAIGLLSALQESARPGAAASLLAWTIMFGDPLFELVRDGHPARTSSELPSRAGELTRELLKVSKHLADRFYPSVNPVPGVVDVICQVLIGALGADATRQVVAALVQRLDDDYGREFFAAYIASASV